MSQPPQPPLPILPARVDHVRAYVAYVAEHVAESGRDGYPRFALSSTIAPEEARQTAVERWSRGLDEPLWGRAWLLWTAAPDKDKKGARVAGHVELRGGRVKAEMHRAVLSMGVLRTHVGQGHGRRLMEEALAWARGPGGLDYVDLGVFVNNTRAARFYEKMGFVPQTVRKDAFRVEGASIDDMHMTLDLRAPGR